MSKQDKFINAISINDINQVKLLLTSLDVHPNVPSYDALAVSAKLGYIDIVKLLLQDNRVYVKRHQNLALRLSVENGYPDITKLFLKDIRINPSEYNNSCIKIIYNKIKKNEPFINKSEHYVKPPENGFEDAYNLLCNDHRIRSTLQQDVPELYSEIITKEVKNKVGNF